MRKLHSSASQGHLLTECNSLQAGATVPPPVVGKPSWLQHTLSQFVQLRMTAAELEADGELLCMPVVITASTRSLGSSLQGTASGESRVKDVHLRPLTDGQMQAVVSDLTKRIQDAPEVSSSIPDKLKLLLQLTGGNPRMVSRTLCLLAGSSHTHSEEFPAV